MPDPVQLDAAHALFWRISQSSPEEAFRDALNHGCDAECSQCAAIFCPHHHPLHFHHDGCPACLGLDDSYPAPIPQEPHHD